LRQAIRAQTPLGREAKTYMDRGDLVPDDLMIKFIDDYIVEADGKSFVLDGFPRTDAQATALDELLERLERPIDLVVYTAVPDELIVGRLSGRRTCPKCQRAYHMVSNPPRTDEQCDDDGTSLVTRPDDSPETVQHRLDVYHRDTKGLLRFYADKGILVEVDGVGDVDEVAKRIDEAIESGP
jgi:adenylate kinase